MPPARDSASEEQSEWRFDLLGFPISVPWNALLGVLLIAALWYPEFTGPGTRGVPWLTAAMFAVLLMGSILLHELAHGLAARAFGYPVAGITLWLMGGFTSYTTTKRHGPLREATIALAGPVTTLAVAAISYLLLPYAPRGPLLDLLQAMVAANLLIGVFNLLPGAPLDGGAVVKAVVWALTGSDATGQVAAAWAGRVLAAVVLVVPLATAWSAGTQPSFPALLIGVMLAWLLWSGASASLRAARGARSLAAVPAINLGRPVQVVPADASVAQLLPLLGAERHLVVVDPAGTPLGVVQPDAARAVPPQHAGGVTATAVVVRLAPDTPVVAPDATAADVLHACQRTGSRYVLVAVPGSLPHLIDTDVSFIPEDA